MDDTLVDGAGDIDFDSPPDSSEAVAEVTTALPAKILTPHFQDDDPGVLARRWLRSINGSNSLRIIRFWRDEFWIWKDGAYRSLTDSELQAKATSWLIGEFARIQLDQQQAHEAGKREKPPGPAKKATRAAAGDLQNALKSLVIIGNAVESPAWLDGRTTFAPRELIAFPNGILHVPSGQFLEPTPDFFTTTAVQFDYDPHAPEPITWLKFLRETLPNDPEAVDTLQEVMAYFLTPDTSQQKIFGLIGQKRSGKSTTAKVITAIVGAGNVASPAFSDLASEFGLAPLVGRTLAIFADVRVGRHTDMAKAVETLLKISGEDSMNVNRKFKSHFIGRLHTRLLIVSNELPEFVDPAGALAGRLILVQFTETFYGREDHGLEQRLMADLPGILLWAIQGWHRLRKRGRLVQPASGQRLVASIMDISNPIGHFLRQKCRRGGSVVKDELYKAYVAWCEESGCNAMTKAMFHKRLGTAAPDITESRPRVTNVGDAHLDQSLDQGTRKRVYEGVSIKPYPEDDDDRDEWSRCGPGAVQVPVQVNSLENKVWSKWSNHSAGTYTVREENDVQSNSKEMPGPPGPAASECFVFGDDEGGAA